MKKFMDKILIWIGKKITPLLKCKWGRALYGFIFGGLIGALMMKTGFLIGRNYPDAEDE